MSAPTIDDYPPATQIRFTGCPPHWEIGDIGTYYRSGALAVMEEVDEAFVRQMKCDKLLKEAYESKLDGEIDKPDDDDLRSQLMHIMRALRNRVFYATRQKHRISYFFPFIEPKKQRERVTEEAKNDLGEVMDLLLPWDSPRMKQLFGWADHCQELELEYGDDKDDEEDDEDEDDDDDEEVQGDTTEEDEEEVQGDTKQGHTPEESQPPPAKKTQAHQEEEMLPPDKKIQAHQDEGMRPLTIEDYPPATQIRFTNCPPDWEIRNIGVYDGIDALLVMEEVDEAFVRQLNRDEVLKEVYESKVNGEIEEPTDDGIRSQLMHIERALENRVKFAIRQKRRIKCFFPFIEPKQERERVAKEANEDLVHAVELLYHWNSRKMERLCEIANSCLEMELKYDDDDEVEGRQDMEEDQVVPQ